MNSILYIFLPCKKVYPIGVTYLADFIHRRKPDVRQRILDLSLFPDAQRSSAVRDAATEFKPDLVCFSWRDIQIFSPHEGDSSLEHAFNFYFASNPLKRVVASFAGVQQLYRYYSHIRAALSYPWLIAKEFPKAQIMIGGGAFTAFADQLIQKLPEGTIGILGEGEDAILKVIEGQSLEKERYILREGKTDSKGPAGFAGPARCAHRRLALPDLDFPAASGVSGRIHRGPVEARLPLRLRVLPLSLH